MTEITRYVANDGKEFDDEDDCMEYEMSLMPGANEVTMLAHCRNGRLSITHDIEDASYMYVHTSDAVDYLTEKGDYIGVIVPESVGFFRWNGDRSEWIDIEMEIEQLQEIIEELKKGGVQ